MTKVATCFPFRGLLVFILLIPSLAAEPLTDPFHTANRHPIIHPYGLPNARSAYILDKDSWQSLSNIEIGTIAIGESPGANVIFDGETHEYFLDLSYGINDLWEVGFSINYLSHTGGGLDNLITEWHDIFGLPNGDRNLQGTHELIYYVEDTSGVRLDFRDHQKGFGDMQFHFGYQLTEQEKKASSLRGVLKIPTGAAEKLTGSEGVDLALSYHYSQKDIFDDGEPWTWHANLGLLYTEKGKILSDIRRQWMVFSSTTLAWNNDLLALKLQFDYHSPFYRSSNSNIDDHALQVVFGGTVKIDRKNFIDIAVTEDIQVRQSPDIVFILSYRWISL